MATGINLSGRIPAIVRPISGKVFIVGIVLALFLIGAVVFGFCYRIKRQERMKEAQQTQTVASDASTSNREQIEGGQPSAAFHLIRSAYRDIAKHHRSNGKL